VNDLLVFNHHSLPFSNKPDAERCLPDFIKICIKCRNMGFHTILVDESVDADWFRLKLSEGYFWQDWYNRHNEDNDKDLIRAFRSIKTNQPLFSLKDIENHIDLFEVEFQGQTDYPALCAAVWNDAPMTSFPSGEIWSQSPLSVITKSMNDDEEIVMSDAEITNLYSLRVWDDLQSVFLAERNEKLKQGYEILSRWA